MILHPVPVELIPKEMLLQEHFEILETHDAISSGTFTSDDSKRWREYLPALYDRYRKGFERLTQHYGMDLHDPFHAPLADGASVIYPDIPRCDADDFFLKIMVQGTVLEY